MGKYCRNKPLVFSFVPRCHGLCGSQKYTFTFVATVKRLCEANSVPRSHVRDAINPFGSVRTALANARTTLAVSFFLGTVGCPGAGQ